MSEGDTAGARGRGDLLVAAGLVSLPVLGALVTALRTDWYPASDLAAIQLATMDVPGHPPLVGVASRLGFHHPGPALFYLDAIPYRLLGPRGLLVAAALVNLAAVIALVALLRRRGGRPLLAIGTIALLVLELTSAETLADPWNPYVVVLPFALGIVLAWSVWERDWWALPALVAVLSIVVQAHVGYALEAVWLVGSAGAWALWCAVRRRPGAPRARVLVAALGVGLVLAVPPVLDQVRHEPGNLSLLIDHLGRTGDPVLGWSTAGGLLARELGVLAPWLSFDEPLQPFIGGVEPAPLWWLVPFLVLFAVAWWWAARSRRMDAVRFDGVLAGVLAVGAFSVARIVGDPLPYLLRWLWPVAALGWTAIVWSALPRAWADGRPPARVARPAAFVGLALAVLLAAVGTVAATTAPVPDAPLSDALAALTGPVEAAVRDRGTVVIGTEGPGYGEVAVGLVAALERRKVFLAVPNSEAPSYGAHRTIGDRPVDAHLVVAVADGLAARDARGDQAIARYDPLSPDERKEADVLQARAGRAYADLLAGHPATDPLSPAEVERLRELGARGPEVGIFLDPVAPAQGT